MLSPAQRSNLIAAAIAVRDNAYAKYSHFHVGAALLTDNGNMYVGCNVENISYGLTICAERFAVGAMIASGEREPTAIAIVTKGAERRAALAGKCWRSSRRRCQFCWSMQTPIRSSKRTSANCSHRNSQANSLGIRQGVTR